MRHQRSRNATSTRSSHPGRAAAKTMRGTQPSQEARNHGSESVVGRCDFRRQAFSRSLTAERAERGISDPDHGAAPFRAPKTAAA